MTALLAAALAALAAWLATPRVEAPRRLATLHAAAADAAPAGTAVRDSAPTRAAAGGQTTVGGVAASTAPGLRGAVVARGGKVIAAVVGRVRARARKREISARWAEAGIELCQSMAAELRAGRTPGDALQASVDVLPARVRTGLRGVAAVASAAGDVPAELAAVADSDPGAAGLRQVAAAWRVGAASGSGLADVLERVAQSLRDDQAHRAQVAAQLAGPRATARLLAMLPLLGLGLAAGSGSNPFDFLLGTPAGLACLAAGLGLNALGLWWSTQITKAAVGQASGRHVDRRTDRQGAM